MTDRLLTTVIVERPDLAADLARRVGDLVGCRVYEMGDCRAILTHEIFGAHLSISTGYRDPTWDEIATMRYKLLPDVKLMAMFLPELSTYVNLHPFTFHLYEQRQ